MKFGTVISGAEMCVTREYIDVYCAFFISPSMSLVRDMGLQITQLLYIRLQE